MFMVLVGDWKSELLRYYPSCKPLIIDTNIIGNKTRMIGRGSVSNMGSLLCPWQFRSLESSQMVTTIVGQHCHLLIIKVTLASKQEHCNVLFFRTCSKYAHMKRLAALVIEDLFW